MRLLDRYLLRELLIPLAVCLGAFLIVWIAFDLFTQLSSFQEHQLLFRDVLKYYLYRIPEFLVLILPIVLLIALLYTLTNHARHNELTAIRASGVSLWRICLPYLVVGFVFSVGVLVLNEQWVPDNSDMAEQLKHLDRTPGKMVAAADKDVHSSLTFKHSRDSRMWVIKAYNTRTAEMTAPLVEWTLANGTRMRLTAKSGGYTNGVWTFNDVQEYHAREPKAELALFLQTNVLSVAEFAETPDQFRREIKIAARFSQMEWRSPEIPVLDILDYLDLHSDLTDAFKCWLFTQLHGHLAEPWTCLVVVVIAIPFGAASGRRNLFVGVASSIVICFSYFILLKLGLAAGTGGLVPAWIGAWMPNAVFATTGIWLMLRVR